MWGSGGHWRQRPGHWAAARMQTLWLGSMGTTARPWPAAAGGRGAPGGLRRYLLAAGAGGTGAGGAAAAAAAAAAVGDGRARTRWLAGTRPACNQAAGAACGAQRRGTPTWLCLFCRASWCVCRRPSRLFPKMLCSKAAPFPFFPALLARRTNKPLLHLCATGTYVGEGQGLCERGVCPGKDEVQPSGLTLWRQAREVVHRARDKGKTWRSGTTEAWITSKATRCRPGSCGLARH